MDMATLMALFGSSAGAAGAGAAATGAATGAAPGLAASLGPAAAAGAPTVMAAPGVAPAMGQLGSGTLGVMDSMPAVAQLGPAGPMGTEPVAQGMGPLMNQPLGEAQAEKLARAPLDPSKILQIVKSQQGQDRPPTPGSAGPGSREVEMGMVKGAKLQGNRPGLAQFLGK